MTESTSHLTQRELHLFLKSDIGRKMLTKHGLRRTLNPRQQYAEAVNVHPIQLHVTKGAFMKPTGSIQAGEGMLLVKHNRNRGAGHEKLLSLGAALGEHFSLRVSHTVPEKKTH